LQLTETGKAMQSNQLTKMGRVGVGDDSHSDPAQVPNSSTTQRVRKGHPTSCLIGLPSGTNSMGRPSWALYHVCSGTPSVW
jgi:hypothetical protein